jgi:hypothetical protein
MQDWADNGNQGASDCQQGGRGREPTHMLEEKGHEAPEVVKGGA